MAHDDACSADVLAVWAARHRDQMRKEMSRGGLGMISMDIPIPVFGGTMTAPNGRFGRSSDNPYAAPPSINALSQKAQSLDTTGGLGSISGWATLNKKNRKS